MSFLNSIFLWFIPVALVPVIIHLINRSPVKKIEFPTVKFLMPASKKVLRKFKLLQLLLLLLRVFIILLLTLAFARPVFEGYPEKEEEMRYNIILIDNSYTMSYKLGHQTALDKAKELAKKVVETTDGEFAVGTLNDGLSGITELKGDKESLRREIDNVSITYFKSDIIKGVESAGEYGKENFPEGASYNIFLFSDLNKAGFSEKNFGAPARMSGVRFVLVEVCEGNKNIFFEVPENINGFADIPIDLSVNINSSYNSEGTAEIIVDGNSINKSFFQMEQNNTGEIISKEISFRHNFNRPGNYPGKINLESRLEMDRIRLDNAVYFKAEIAPRLRALIVDGSPGYTLMDSESYFFTRALSPGAYSSPVVYRVVTPREFENINIREYDQVFLLNASLTDNMADRLLQFSQTGGAIGIFAGDNLNFEVYADFIEALMPVELLSRESVKVGSDSRENNIKSTGDFTSIFQPSGANPGITEILRTRAQGKFEPVLKLDQNPLLWIYSAARANTTFFTSSASARWGEFPLKSPYPAFINILVKKMATGVSEAEKIDYKVGDILEIESHELDKVKIQSGAEEKNLESALEKLPRATVPGNYIIDQKIIPVNMDFKGGGSKLESLDGEDVKQIFEAGQRVFYVPYSDDIYSDIIRQITGEEKSTIFLIIAFIMLICEEILRRYIQFAQR